MDATNFWLFPTAALIIAAGAGCPHPYVAARTLTAAGRLADRPDAADAEARAGSGVFIAGLSFALTPRPVHG